MLANLLLASDKRRSRSSALGLSTPFLGGILAQRIDEDPIAFSPTPPCTPFGFHGTFVGSR